MEGAQLAPSNNPAAPVMTTDCGDKGMIARLSYCFVEKPPAHE